MTDDEDDDDKVLVGVRITPERRDKWKQFVDESDEYSSMADIMRTGVSRVMTEDSGEAGQLADQMETVSGRLGSVFNQVRELQQEMEKVQNELNDVDDIAAETAFRVDQLPQNSDETLSQLVEELAENEGESDDE